MLQRYSFAIWYLVIVGGIALIATVFTSWAHPIVPLFGLLMVIGAVTYAILFIKKGPIAIRRKPRKCRRCSF